MVCMLTVTPSWADTVPLVTVMDVVPLLIAVTNPSGVTSVILASPVV